MHRDYSMYDSQKGFTTLFAVTIISMVLLFAVITLGRRGIEERLMILDLERKAQSESYARACVEIARMSIASDPDYRTSMHAIPVGKGNCLLFDVSPHTPSTGQSRIQATSTVSSASTRLEVVVDTSTAQVLSWREVLTF